MLLKYFIRNICCLLFILVCLGVYANAQSDNTDITFTIIDKDGNELVDEDGDGVYDEDYKIYENSQMHVTDEARHHFRVVASEVLTKGKICFDAMQEKYCIEQGKDRVDINVYALNDEVAYGHDEGSQMVWLYEFTINNETSVYYRNAFNNKQIILPKKFKVVAYDNDTAGFKVTIDNQGDHEAIATEAYTIDETGGEQIFYVLPTSRPSDGSEVIVNIRPSDSKQAFVQPKTMTFNKDNYHNSQKVTVTAKDNEIAGDNKEYNIEFTVDGTLTTATEYTKVPKKSLKIQNNDNDDDTAGFKVTTDNQGDHEVIAETTYKIDEKGGEKFFYVKLTSEPKGKVIVKEQPSDREHCKVSPKTLTFDASNWKQPHKFKVAAINNNIAGKIKPYNINFTVDSSRSNEYKDAIIKPLKIQNNDNDNDKAGFRVTTDSEGENEVIAETYKINEGNKKVFYVKVTSQPKGDVNVNVNSSNSDQGGVSNGKLIFTKDNWSERQKFTVTANDNDIIEKNASYDIDLTVDAKSTKDAEYKPLTIPSIKIQNDDDDVNKVGTITIVQQFADPNRIFSYTINLSEIIKFNLKSENGVGKKTFRNIFAGTYVITQEDIALMGYGVTSIVCNDNNSVVELASRKVIIKLERLENVVCTFNIVERLKHTSNLISEYLGLRNSLLLAHAPNIDLRIWRFDNSAPPPSVNMAIEKNSVKFNSLLNKNSNKHKLDIWAQGNISRITTNKNQKGVFGVLYGGIDFLLNSNILVGGIVQYDLFFQKSYAQHSNEIKGHGWMLGPYVLIKLHPKLYTDARVAWGVSNNNNKPFNTYEDKFHTTRLLASSSLIGKHFIGNWIISPAIKLNYIEENQESYIDSLGVKIPNQKLSQGSIQLNSRISYKHILDNKLEILPWLELKGNYSFFNKKSAFFNKTLLLVKSSIFKQVEDSKKLIGSIKLGLDVMYHTGLKFTLASNINGINSYWKSFGIELNLTVPIS